MTPKESLLFKDYKNAYKRFLMTIECTKYKPVNKGALLGFADLYIPKFGIEVFGCAIFEKGTHKWVTFPQKEVTDELGVKKYFSHLRFKEKSHMDAFSNAAVQAIMKKANASQAAASGRKEEQESDEEIPF